jgi:alkanesulfonate monooxygenase SsuD/methylene tetrahydromethanopterin reductase-like flavin-dependent oxidoreductase (luciferase family)
MRRLWSQREASFEGEFLNFKPVYSDPKPVNGTIPIHIGGSTEVAARRAGRLADGYFPALFPNEKLYAELPKLLQCVRESAAEAGRDMSQIELTSGGVRTAEEAKWFAELGVNRMTISVRSKTVPDMRNELMRFGEEVIAKTVDL